MFEIDERDMQLDDLHAVTAGLGTLRPAADDSGRIDRIRALEELQAAAAAAQLAETAAFAASQRAVQAAAGVPAERIGRGIAHQVALAKRISPHRAQRYVGWAMILTSELPQTFARLRAGRTSEWRAVLVARETAWLSRADRHEVDAQLAPRLATLGDRRVELEAKKLAYRLDPEGALAQVRRAAGDRHVSLRPAPEVMARLTALLPMAQGVATYASLRQEADRRIAAGDGRSRGQIMADTVVERLTGQACAADVPVEINLVMTDQTLLGFGDGQDEPAHLEGYGPVPAPVARRLALDPQGSLPRWIRRLYTRPRSNQLVAVESSRREFSAGQQHFLRLRDQWCRTPWCEAPIRHSDHVHPAGEGGRTSTDNGQGHCEACNHAKQAPGWRTRAFPSRDGHLVEIATPTGHHYRSRPPDLPGLPSWAGPLERRLAAILAAA
jgi:hypothetical protein